MNIRDLASKLDAINDLYELGLYVKEITVANEDVGRRIWELLDKRKLASKLSRIQHFRPNEAHMCIDFIKSAGLDMGRELCDHLYVQEVANAVKATRSVSSIGGYIAAIVAANRRVGKKLWRLIDKESLALKLSREPIDWDWAGKSCVSDIWSVDRSMAHDLCGLLDIRALADNWNQSSECWRVGEWFSVVLKANAKAGQQLWQLIDRAKLAAEISQNEHVLLIESGIHNIWLADAEVARELCGMLDIERLLKTFNQEHYAENIARCIYGLLRVNEKVGRMLWELAKKQLATKLSRNFVPEKSPGCFKFLCSVEPDMGHELCDLLNLDEIVATLDKLDDVFFIGVYFSAIFWANEQVGRKLWQVYGKKLATKLNVCEDIKGATLCVENIYSCDHGMARDLCSLLDPTKLVQCLESWGDDKRRENYLDVIEKANKQVYQEVLKLLAE